MRSRGDEVQGSMVVISGERKNLCNCLGVISTGGRNLLHHSQRVRFLGVSLLETCPERSTELTPKSCRSDDNPLYNYKSFSFTFAHYL